MSSSDDRVAKYYTKIKWNLKALHYSLTAVELLLKLVQDAAKCVSGGIERYIAYKGCQQSTSFIDKTVLYDHLHSVKSLIHVKDIVDLSYERVGPDTDGGYVMVKGLKLKDTEKIAYSFGIGAEPGWDLAMAERGYEVYMYDHTLDPSALKFSNSHCHFFPIGVCGNIAMDNCQTLQALLQKNGHESQHNMILKMDIEGCEWEVLRDVPEEILSQFSQIILEMHEMTDLKIASSIKHVLGKIARTHEPVHIHANNCSCLINVADMVIPQSLEVTYLRKGDAVFKPSRRFFPTEIDRPCDKKRLDVELGYWS